MSLTKHEQMIEIFDFALQSLAKQFAQKATYTVSAGWVTIQFGNLYTVKKRGYAACLNALDALLYDLTV